MFASGISAMSLEESFDAFLSTLLHMIARKPGQYAEERACTSDIFLGHRQECFDPSRVDHRV